MTRIHVYIGRNGKPFVYGRARVTDAAPLNYGALYADLLRRMNGALEELARKARDEWKESLHPRRSDGKFGTGNVQANEAPAKPTTTTAKGGMDKLRELFASGHSFTKEEFLAATGLAEKRLSDYLAMLKNPKWAGAKGALKIERKADGSYFVAHSDGTPAPLPPKEPAPVPKVDPPAERVWDHDEKEKARQALQRRVDAHRQRLRAIDDQTYRSEARANAQRIVNGVATSIASGFVDSPEAARRHNDQMDVAASYLYTAEKEHREHQARKAAERAKAAAAPSNNPAEGFTGPATPFVPQKDHKAAAEWALRNNLADGADFSGMHMDAVNSHLETLHAHLTEFPAMRSKTNFVGSFKGYKAWYAKKSMDDYINRMAAANPHMSLDTVKAIAGRSKMATPKTPANAWAAAWSGSNGRDSVATNHMKLGKSTYGEFLIGAKSSIATRWHPTGCDTIKSVYDHEYGHTLDGMLGLRSNPEFVKIMQDAATEKPWSAATMTGPSPAINTVNQRKENIKHNLSAYGATNAGEFVAEAWSEFRNNPTPRPIAQRVGELIRSEYAKRFPNQAGRSIPDAGRVPSGIATRAAQVA